MNKFRNLLKDNKAATAIEYGLIAALIAVAAIGILGQVGTSLTGKFTEVKEGLDGPAPAP